MNTNINYLESIKKAVKKILSNVTITYDGATGSIQIDIKAVSVHQPERCLSNNDYPKTTTK